MFEELEFLGAGGFGTVYKVRNIYDQKMFAIKENQIQWQVLCLNHISYFFKITFLAYR